MQSSALASARGGSCCSNSRGRAVTRGTRKKKKKGHLMSTLATINFKKNSSLFALLFFSLPHPLPAQAAPSSSSSASSAPHPVRSGSSERQNVRRIRSRKKEKEAAAAAQTVVVVVAAAAGCLSVEHGWRMPMMASLPRPFSHDYMPPLSSNRSRHRHRPRRVAWCTYRGLKLLPSTRIRPWNVESRKFSDRWLFSSRLSFFFPRPSTPSGFLRPSLNPPSLPHFASKPSKPTTKNT